MTRPTNHLRREVLRRAAERVGLFSVLLNNLGETEISQHDVAVLVEENIFGFQISIDNVAAVQVAKC
jgi:hypothetical protein